MAPRVSRYARDTVYVVYPSDNLAHARNVMLRRGVGRLVVIDEAERPVGILTLTDLVNALVNTHYARPLDKILVEEVMTKNVITIEPTKSIKTAAQLMLKYNIGGLPVVNKEGRLTGIITRTDLTRAFYERFEGKYRVADLKRPAYARAEPGHSIYYLSRLLEMDPSGKIVIMDENNRPIGIVTKQDLAFASISVPQRVARGKNRYVKVKVAHFYNDEKIVPVRIYLVPVARDVMTENPITITDDADAAEAARVMVEEGIGALPVVDENGVLTGLITKREFLYAIARG